MATFAEIGATSEALTSARTPVAEKSGYALEAGFSLADAGILDAGSSFVIGWLAKNGETAPVGSPCKH